ncbi:MAG: pantoate--beta-alanine ligase [Kiloniellales bacterium]|nr:pantoate--beta-alanine ligase [Kiloniellales bacterium]
MKFSPLSSGARDIGTGELEVVKDLETLRRRVADWRLAGQKIGLVPTMGALHAGHLALVEASKIHCPRTVVTIFVNPIQFNSSSDLDSYPRQESEDLDLLAKAGVDLVYMPQLDAMYPEGFATRVSVGVGLGDCLCGAARPGHMEGVATVVTKLFLRTLPDKAYFGEKDFQQLLIIKRMSQDLDMPLKVIPVETVRESDGLALSSRNFNLSTEERAVAPLLYRELSGLAEVLRDGSPAAPLLKAATARLLKGGFAQVDYLELRAEEDLRHLAVAEGPCRLFAAAFLGDVRLIDNVKVA